MAAHPTPESIEEARVLATQLAAEVEPYDSVGRVGVCRELLAQGQWVTGRTGPWLAAAWHVSERTVSRDLSAARLLFGEGAAEARALGAQVLVRALEREEALAEALGGRLARDADADEPEAVRDLASAYRSVTSGREKAAEVLVLTLREPDSPHVDDGEAETFEDYTDEELRALSVLEARKARLQKTDA